MRSRESIFPACNVKLFPNRKMLVADSLYL